ncbi:MULTISPECIES: bifunctional DNA-formamidopyrimidine glycosylase/DNA-(apurinic or apyrimidinic site) lyase [Halocynthiibacter]|uniref:Formamidopyrimidine-DNA glycosylase n=1 Tax=Halocynthiibacter halioticoli TaxID=2986804 RepID=A0AAE3IVR6_9RHOB|nr:MULTISPECIES: bifunctional DNA-formamidopyrimidine glycosylase/DNA-(apurinic or apyrimidinic site) lyase [Halocynthiibacter]MCV6823057.1 bifunctional DNA-formamidopyrimidine glycosylase/DNA-(apurinic or apyrimidinic site) lyase [Halocynthiibacter halioticoli]MCW4056058.1 bifunctional DNA-formamidopyrimidine glycosylase/DNA-(apurinic or apyrimidinic site) lyase [Halocynthiibacter sp. SDUM655004]
MPELPEVETVRRGLLPVMERAVITKADIRRPDLRWPFPPDMAARLTGARILGLRRRSKYILANLDTGETLLIHLGMSGRMLISGGTVGDFHFNHPAPEKHDHVVLDFDNGARVTFNDPRRFGAMDLLNTDTAEEHKLLKVLGPEPFGNEFNETYLAEKLATKTAPMKSVLLDQRIVAGLGNIYVCEILFRTGISPRKQAKKLRQRDIAALVPAIRDVLSEAIEAGGSTLKDHRQADGDLGYFQHSFKVYGREGESCVNTECNAKIERISQSGRSTFYCPTCQR